MVINENCKVCQIKRNIDKYPLNATEEEIKEYQHKVKEIVENSDGLSTPQVAEKMDDLRRKIFGNVIDYTEIKQHYNQLMLDYFPYMKNKVDTSENHLKTAIQYAMVGNYIDFGALENVNEGELKVQLDEAVNITIDSKLLDVFKNDLVNAKRLVYFTDNCGEIVLDKLAVKILKEKYPQLNITVIVRGYPVVNDATMEDAEEIGLTDIVKVTGNGSNVGGTWFPGLSNEARTLLEQADVILAKGQGNFETMNDCGLNVYYLFLCKCDLFQRRFHAKALQGMFLNERRIQMEMV